MVVSQDQLETNLYNSSEFFKVHFEDDISIFILFVKIDANISVINRIRQPELQDENMFLSKLQEYRSLFDFMAEEDPEYRLLQDLQNAGILPVN